MAFPEQITQLADVPAWAQEYYGAAESGQYRLQIQTVPHGEDVSGLKSALKKERQMLRDTEQALSELKGRYEGIDPVEVKTMKERLEGLRDKQIYDDKGLEALVNDRTARMQEAHRIKVVDLTKELDAERSTRQRGEMQLRHQQLETHLRQAAVDAGVPPHAIPDAVGRMNHVFTDLNDAGTPVARAATGELQYGRDALQPLTPREFLEGLKQTAHHLWPGSSGAGGIGQGGAGPQPVILSRADARNTQIYERALKEATERNVPLDIR